MEPLTWWQSGVIYQIYPRSFADANGDGVGDLRGILDHLDYLNDGTDDSLGVAAIWLSPFYRSPMADFGYDISDYTDVDPVFGTLADFDDLLADVHRHGIKLIVDWVPNHTSDQHPWFVESARSLDNAKRDWYVWRDPAPDGGPPNNWRSAFPAVGSAWTFDKTTAQYYLHSFTPHQPDLNWDNPEVEAAMHDVLRFWLDRGVDGFRIDVIYKIAKDPELRDNEPGLQHDEDWPTIHDRLRRIRAVIEKYDDRMIVGEVYLLDLKKLVEYINTETSCTWPTTSSSSTCRGKRRRTARRCRNSPSWPRSRPGRPGSWRIMTTHGSPPATPPSRGAGNAVRGWQLC